MEKATIKVNVNDSGDYMLEEIYQKRKMKVSANDRTVQFITSDIPQMEAEIWTIRKGKR